MSIYFWKQKLNCWLNSRKGLLKENNKTLICLIEKAKVIKQILRDVIWKYILKLEIWVVFTRKILNKIKLMSGIYDIAAFLSLCLVSISFFIVRIILCTTIYNLTYVTIITTITAYIHNWPLQLFSQDYRPNFSNHLRCVR